MIARLSRSAQDRARNFVVKSARPLDQAWLDYHLPAQPQRPDLSALIAELARFRTPEGGFGHGLEPDLKTPASSAIATSIAFQYLRDVGSTSDIPLVRGAIQYLVTTVDRSAWVWPAVDGRVEEAPHAPWWRPGLDRFRGYVFNPSAELLGCLYANRVLVAPDVLEGATNGLIAALDRVEMVDSPYEIACCLRLAQTEGLPAQLRDKLYPRLQSWLKALAAEDGHLDALHLAPRPGVFGYDILRPAIERQAVRLVATQDDDGGWRPQWTSWDGEAEKAWRGVITARALAGLSAHGFLD